MGTPAHRPRRFGCRCFRGRSKHSWDNPSQQRPDGRHVGAQNANVDFNDGPVSTIAPIPYDVSEEFVSRRVVDIHVGLYVVAKLVSMIARYMLTPVMLRLSVPHLYELEGWENIQKPSTEHC